MNLTKQKTELIRKKTTDLLDEFDQEFQWHQNESWVFVNDSGKQKVRSWLVESLLEMEEALDTIASAAKEEEREQLCNTLSHKIDECVEKTGDSTVCVGERVAYSHMKTYIIPELRSHLKEKQK